MLKQKFKFGGIKFSIFLSLFILAVAAFLITNKQYVIDQITVWNYKPTSEITALVDRAGMNSNGRFIYYASQPKIDGTQDFNTECKRVENITSILGCYSDDKIYIYDVKDPQLDGIREVTAAHETLHAIYVRLSDSERGRVDSLLEAEYKKLETNEDFKQRIAFYAKTEPGQRDNELHSMIGTEVADISADLENYYDKYFSDRKKVVDLNNKYISVFQGFEARATDLSNQLMALEKKIQSNIASYNSSIVTLNNDIGAFNKRANSGGFVSQSQFYSERSVLISRSSELELLRNSINADIEAYNALLNEYNSIASQTEKLYNSIDSTLAPAPSI